MSRDNKRHAIIGGIALLVILLLLMARRHVTNLITNNSGGIQLGGVSIPGFDMPERMKLPPIISNFGAPDTTMIGACCADCSKPQSYMPARAGNTYVFDAAQVPANVFIYIPPPPPPPPSFGAIMSAGSWG